MIKIYTIDGCGYCNKLKALLEKEGLPFEEVNASEEENKEEYDEVRAACESDMVPIIRIENELLVPEASFNTIEEAARITKKLYLKYQTPSGE
jgi:glutaredoxin|tara:strand:+ start:907 stop:1185 length:279 start_codon:yes stop_codon:yes gene_type:complete